MPRPRIKPVETIENPWELLESGIIDTIAQSQSNLSISALHTACGQLVSNGEYDRVFNGLMGHITEQFDKWHTELRNNAGDPLLNLFNRIYNELQNYCQIFPKFYMLYDRHFKNEKDKTLNAIKRLFKEKILSDKELIQNATIPSLLKNIQYAENRHDVDIAQIKNIVNMLYSFSNGNKADSKENFGFFWNNLLEQTDKFYEEFFNQKYKSLSFVEYLKTTREQFNLEQTIMNKLLNEQDAKEILATAFNQMFISREDILFAQPDPPVANGMKEDTPSMRWVVDSYMKLEASIEGLYNSLAKYIQTQMLTIKIENNAIPAGIKSLIELTQTLKNNYNAVFDPKQFEGARIALNQNIKQAWNNDQFKITENFNQFIDDLIKNKFKGENKPEMCTIIGDFFEYITDKQGFKTIYNSYFVRRLIKLTKDLPESEFPVITSIRKKNSDFLPNYDDFIQQMRESLKLFDDFKNAINNAEKTKIEPFIFKQQNFPLSKAEEKFVPQEIQEINNEFITFYKKANPETELILLNQCSSIEFKLRVLNKNKAVNYSLTTDIPCGFVLLAIYNSKKLTYKQIIESLNNDSKVAKKVVFRLTKTVPLLYRKPANPANASTLNDGDILILNPKFKSKQLTINVPPAISEIKEQQHLNEQYIQAERIESIRACIVRTLKQQGKLESTKLEIAVIQALQDYFEPNIQQIRKEVNDLCDNYLEKETLPDGTVILKYIA